MSQHLPMAVHDRARRMLCTAAPWIYLGLAALLARTVLTDSSATFSRRSDFQLCYVVGVVGMAHQISRCGTWICQTISLAGVTSRDEEVRALDRISNLGIVATIVLFGPSLLVSFATR